MQDNFGKGQGGRLPAIVAIPVVVTVAYIAFGILNRSQSCSKGTGSSKL